VSFDPERVLQADLQPAETFGDDLARLRGPGKHFEHCSVLILGEFHVAGPLHAVLNFEGSLRGLFGERCDEAESLFFGWRAQQLIDEPAGLLLGNRAWPVDRRERDEHRLQLTDEPRRAPCQGHEPRCARLESERPRAEGTRADVPEFFASSRPTGGGTNRKTTGSRACLGPPFLAEHFTNRARPSQESDS
jgi:hypothetical protein